MTFAEFQKTIVSGAVPAVLLFHGEEPYLARLGVELLRRRLFPAGGEAFDLVSMTGRDATAEAIAAQAATVPMLSERRLTVVYEFDELAPTQRAKLVGYLDRPVTTSCLALVSFGRLSGSTKFERDVLSRSAVVECGLVSGEALAALIGRMAEERGRRMDAGAGAALAEASGGSLQRIANELDKLACFVPEGEAVSAAHVERVVGIRASGLTDLVRAVAERDLGAALGLADQLMEGGAEGAQLVSQLWGHWLALWGARAGQGGRAASFGGWMPARESMRDLATLARGRTSREYASGVRAFRRADADIRSGMPARATVSILLQELVRGA